MNKPLVSVIMPLFNSEKFVVESIESVLEQKYRELELIIVDDCSTDKSVEIVTRYLNDQRLTLIKLPENQGQGSSRNVGLKHAKGDYIAFIDSDDVWKENKLEFQLIFMQRTNCDFSYTNLAFINEFGETIKSRLSLVTNKVNYNDLLKNNYIATSTVIISKNLISKYKFPDYRKKQDYILWLEILKEEKIEAKHLDEILTLYRKHKNQTTNNKLNLITLHYKILRETQKLNIISSIYFTLTWGFLGFYKHYLKNE